MANYTSAENAAKPNAAGISIRHLYKIFGHNPQACVQLVKDGMTKAELNDKHGHILGLRDINIDIPAGGIQVVMGLSGSGKSTLIRHINRLIDPTSGELLVDGDDVVTMSPAQLREFRRHKTAMVFQKFALLPHRTVLENTVYGLEIQGAPRATQLEQAHRWIERVGLKGFEEKYPNQLSGGMQQRVGLARALTNDAPILLMDEAFSALDPLIRVDMQSVLLGLQKEIKKTVIFITHDLDEALRLGDHIAILRDGEIIQQGTGQDIVLNPADAYIESFVQEVNRGRVIRVDTIMTPPQMDDANLPVIRFDSLLEEAMRKLVDEKSNRINICCEQGRIIGQTSTSSVMAAMVRR